MRGSSRRQTGLALINWIAEVTYDSADEKQLSGWFRQVPVESFLQHFADWTWDWLDVPALIDCKRPEIERFWQQFFRLTCRLASSPVPVIAALSGHAPAGGAVLALQCDYRIAIAGNFKIGLNEVQVGLPVPGTILLALEQVIGARLAQRIATRGSLLPMTEALAIGLVDELVDAESLMSTALIRARELLALPPVAMNTTRLAAKARLIDAYSDCSDVATATDWWFSTETRTEMRKLVERLAKK